MYSSGSHTYEWHWTNLTPLVPIHMSGTELILLLWFPHTLLAWLPAMFAHKPLWRSAAGLQDAFQAERQTWRVFNVRWLKSTLCVCVCVCDVRWMKSTLCSRKSHTPVAMALLSDEGGKSVLEIERIQGVECGVWLPGAPPVEELSTNCKGVSLVAHMDFCLVCQGTSEPNMHIE